MVSVLRHLIGWLAGLFRSREDLLLENLALRQQLLAVHSRRPRPRLSTARKLFWVILRRIWSGWKRPLVLVTPKTVVAWHRAGFRLYWKWLSRARRVGGRKRVSPEVRALIFRMASENPTWGAPRIHGELLKLGFRSLRSDGLAMASTRPKNSRSYSALAYLPTKSSRGDRRDGLLHGTDAHVRGSVLLLCH